MRSSGALRVHDSLLYRGSCRGHANIDRETNEIRARSSASHPHRLLHTGSCEVPASKRRPIGNHGSGKAGRSAGRLREPDPRLGRRIRCQTATSAQLRLHQASAAGEQRHPPACPLPCGVWLPRVPRVRRHLGDRRRYRTDGQSVRCFRRLMNIPGVGQLTALACTTAVVGEPAVAALDARVDMLAAVGAPLMTGRRAWGCSSAASTPIR